MVIGTCINPLCKKEGRLSRGLCVNCMAAARNLIRLGFTTNGEVGGGAQDSAKGPQFR